MEKENESDNKRKLDVDDDIDEQKLSYSISTPPIIKRCASMAGELIKFKKYYFPGKKNKIFFIFRCQMQCLDSILIKNLTQAKDISQ